MAGSKAITVADALARVLDGVRRIDEIEIVPIEAADGRVLAAPLAARLTQPPFDASAMDGYAVRAADVARLPARLAVIGEAAAGHAFTGVLGPGQAVRIFTGAPLPAGADAVVIQENTRRDGDMVEVSLGTPDRDHVRPHGGDFRSGAELLPQGRRLTARDVTLAAAMGHPSVPAVRRPRVAIVATGDELVPPGVEPRADQIVCSNPYGVAAMVRAAGGEPVLLGIAADTRAALEAKIDLARSADVIVTIGGASVGDHDLVGPVLAARGMEPGFWKIAMRPGKPLLFGRLGQSRVLGLPGNPVSSLITTRLFVVPLVSALLGMPAAHLAPRQAIAAVALEANGIREHYMRATLSQTPDGPAVTPVASQDSSLIALLAAADCLIVRPIGAPAIAAGERVPILPLDF
ncbi:MAG: molybdopterin molybdotransferase MoeA [Hyphomicrobiales bacterium]|nr:molybdopterin molybdotransferase MoeA [Hyphomicrobiales bacterium]